MDGELFPQRVHPGQLCRNFYQCKKNTTIFQQFCNGNDCSRDRAYCSYPIILLIVKTNLKAKWVIEFLTMLPWAIPASAIAINIINAFNEPNIFSLNEVLVGTSILLPLGYLIRSLPIIVKTLNVSFQNLNDVYIEASKGLGASSFHTFKNIAVPILFPGILAGFLLIFIRSIGEYTISVFLYNASNKPLSIAMVNGVFEYNLGLAMSYGTLLIVLTFILSVIISKFLKMSSF